jgi:hypothetical protein
MKFFSPRTETAVRGPGGMGSAKPGDTAVVGFWREVSGARLIRQVCSCKTASVPFTLFLSTVGQ